MTCTTKSTVCTANITKYSFQRFRMFSDNHNFSKPLGGLLISRGGGGEGGQEGQGLDREEGGGGL